MVSAESRAETRENGVTESSEIKYSSHTHAGTGPAGHRETDREDTKIKKL